jgi:hypothetical protein
MDLNDILGKAENTIGEANAGGTSLVSYIKWAVMSDVKADLRWDVIVPRGPPEIRRAGSRNERASGKSVGLRWLGTPQVENVPQ